MSGDRGDLTGAGEHTIPCTDGVSENRPPEPCVILSPMLPQEIQYKINKCKDLITVHLKKLINT